ncbi:peptidoglycan D,D-transpeptidase FtsI family protein [Bilifractor sp. HCP3S3_D3]|uniref:peptidoglycan D,D-transpeptidase FtsI family protein n=1 Tax=Bilifractor sp. HCP3S3_D3 TaxID=3438907 RepID=UPI003F8B8640
MNSSRTDRRDNPDRYDRTPETSNERSKNRQKKISRSAIIRPYRIVSFVSLALFASLIVYMVYFQINDSDALLNSPYNKRQEEAAREIIRGSILADDGTTALARTDTADDGTETRVYPYGSLFAQSVGYSVYGGSGLESTHNNDLIQSHSGIVTQMENDLNEQKKAGDNIVTTFNVPLQQAAAAAMGDNSGAVIAMDVDTGSVLVDYSSPTYDPNTVEENWDTLTNSDNGIFLNRATQGLYPPGSTFKIVTALAYLRQNGSFDNFSYNCTGTYENAGFTIHCYNYEAHGQETFASAFANSCNCAFAYMSQNDIDKSTLRQTADDFGLNQAVDTDLDVTTSTFTLDSSTPDQLTMQTAIGQGDTRVTPLQMCMIGQAVANKGVMLKPYFVKSVVSAEGRTVKTTQTTTLKQVMDAGQAANLTEAMRGVVQGGTGTAIADLPYDIVGKTGTAEYDSAGDSHSWFVGFSNTGNNDIVVCAIVENGGDGTAPAINVVRQVFATYFGSES